MTKTGAPILRPKGQPAGVKVHDFIDKELGKAVPYGVYDVGANAGFVSVGIAADTANGARVRLWKVELQKLADETGLVLHVHQYPPGTSKWNRIEQRMFRHITQNWRGRPLADRLAIGELIGATTTKTELSRLYRRLFRLSQAASAAGSSRPAIVGGFGFGRRHVADRLQQAAVVEPVDPFERGVLDGFQRAPRPAPVDHLGLVEPVDRLGERVVVAVADAADRRHEAGLGETLGVLDRDVLHAAIGVVDETAAGDGLSIVERLLQRVEHEARRAPIATRASRRCGARRRR